MINKFTFIIDIFNTFTPNSEKVAILFIIVKILKLLLSIFANSTNLLLLIKL